MTSNSRLAYFNDIPVTNAYPKPRQPDHIGGQSTGKMGSLQRLAIRQRQTPSRNLHASSLRRRLRALLEIERRRRGYGVWQRRTRRTNRSRSHKTQDHTPTANKPVSPNLYAQHQTVQHPIRQLYTNRKPYSQEVRPRILPDPRQERIRLQTEHHPAVL